MWFYRKYVRWLRHFIAQKNKRIFHVSIQRMLLGHFCVLRNSCIFERVPLYDDVIFKR
jgi:hypothetical protein